MSKNEEQKQALTKSFEKVSELSTNLKQLEQSNTDKTNDQISKLQDKLK